MPKVHPFGEIHAERRERIVAGVERLDAAAAVARTPEQVIDVPTGVLPARRDRGGRPAPKGAVVPAARSTNVPP